jgi:hypothetical protein
MTTFLQSFSRQAADAYCGARFQVPSAAQRDAAEFQAVYALVAALLAGGTAIVLTGLSHALGG